MIKFLNFLTKREEENHFLEKNALFHSLFNSFTMGIGLLDLQGNFFKVNQTLCDFFSYSEEEMNKMNFCRLIHPKEADTLLTDMRKIIAGEIKLYQQDYQCLSKNNETIWLAANLSVIRDKNDRPLYFILQAQNVTLQKTAEERLRYMAYHDPLTGLANRSQLEQFVASLISISIRHSKQFAVLFLDLDRFKNVNDTIGHEMGDILLKIIAERLKHNVRSTDIVARLGGDEFVLVITDVTKTEVVANFAQKLLDTFLKRVFLKEKEIYITTSIGISLFPHDGQNMQTLMRNADLALYRAKEYGRNNYQFYTNEMTVRTQERLRLQDALTHALSKEEFLLHYQPRLNLETSSIVGVEALLRWNGHQDFRLITTEEIITIAEEIGLIIPVSNWVLKTACQQLKKWHEQGFSSLTVSINCSQRQFKQANFAEDVLKILEETGIPPKFLELEVKESIIMHDTENTIRVLYALKDLGVRITIDDFGSGYWSLNNLRRLLVNNIKIDKAFIKQVTEDAPSAAIVTAIIAMAKKLEVTVIAEGVETAEQYQFLLKEGCTEIQGYFFSRPLVEEKVSEFLKQNSFVVEKEYY